MVYRKVEGEAKGEAHGDGAGTFDGSSVPLRRWEDWERSRLRKMKRQDRRRKEMERMHPGGYDSGDAMLAPSSTRTSQYDGSDTMSLASSSEDDQWGAQIGGYNENSAAYPPPPVGLYVADQLAASAEGKTVGANDLEAMLEQGFDDPPSARSQPMRAAPGAPRFQLSDGYAPVAHASSPTTPASGAQYSTSHARRRSGGRGNGNGAEPGRYGPLGPLDPGARF